MGGQGSPLPRRWIQTFGWRRQEGRWTQGEVREWYVTEWCPHCEKRRFIVGPPSCLFAHKFNEKCGMEVQYSEVLYIQIFMRYWKWCIWNNTMLNQSNSPGTSPRFDPFLYGISVCVFGFVSMLKQCESPHLTCRSGGGFHIAHRCEWQCQLSCAPFSACWERLQLSLWTWMELTVNTLKTDMYIVMF